MQRTLDSRENARLTAWLKNQRLDRGLTTTQLGELLDAPHSFVSKVEQQQRRLDVVEYLTYCTALKADPIEGLKAIKKNLSVGKMKLR